MAKSSSNAFTAPNLAIEASTQDGYIADGLSWKSHVEQMQFQALEYLSMFQDHHSHRSISVPQDDTLQLIDSSR